MNFRENLRKVFNDEKPDNILWFADLSWWYRAEVQKQTLDEKYKDDGVVQLYRNLGCGIYLPLVDVYRLEIDCKTEIKNEGDIQIKIYKTPFGELREVIRELRDVYTINYDERLLKNSSDINALKYFFESIHYLPDYSQAEHLDEIYGEQGVVVACLPRTPFSRMVVECAGLETTTFAAFESEDEFKQLLNVMEEKDDEAYKIVSESPVEYAMFPDNLSSEMISPKFFSEFSLNYYMKRNEQLHKNNKKTLVHIDGTLKGLLPLLAKSGVDCAEGLTPYPIGDAKPSELRPLTNSEMVLWGGIPSPMFMDSWKIEDFEKYVLSYIEVMKENNKFVIGVGDQVPPNANLERVKLVSEIIKSVS